MLIIHEHGEFIPVDPDEDRKLRSAIPSQSKKEEEDVEFQEDTNGDLTVDFHIERIPGNEGIPEWAAFMNSTKKYRQSGCRRQ